LQLIQFLKNLEISTYGNSDLERHMERSAAS
jgi:hypothetical protein